MSTAAKALAEEDWAKKGVAVPEVKIYKLDELQRCTFASGEVNDDVDEDGCRIYVDGSWRKEALVGGAAAACVTHGWQGSRKLENCTSSTAAELHAIHEAIKHLRGEKVHAAKIMCDSGAAVKEIQFPSPKSANASVIEGIHNVLREVQVEVEVRLIKGHSGSVHNDEVDRLAKEAAGDGGGRVIRCPDTIQVVKARIVKGSFEKWRGWFEERCGGTKRMMMGLSVDEEVSRVCGDRTLLVSMHRARSGKAMTGTTLFQLKARQHDRCERCGVADDIIHVLDTCHKYDTERDAWKQQVKQIEGGDDLRSRMGGHMWSMILFLKESNLIL